MKNICLPLLVSLSVLCGCGGDAKKSDEENVKSDSTYVVAIGMERSGYAGACPGAGVDARRMAKLLSQYSSHVVHLENASATRDAVLSSMNAAAEKADLFIFYYSGHGGSARFSDTGPEEVDGKDEFLCLHDTYMRDNDIWRVFKRCRGRIVMINDCCHSGTMFMAPNPITLMASAPLCARDGSDAGVRLLVLSGCPDDAYSYGSESGGKLTNSLLRHFEEGKSYSALLYDVEHDRDLQRYEKVQITTLGEKFLDAPAFR